MDRLASARQLSLGDLSCPCNHCSWVLGHLRGFFSHMSGTWAGKTQTTEGGNGWGSLNTSSWCGLSMVPAGWPHLGRKAPRLSIPRESSRGCMPFCSNLTLEVTQRHLHCILLIQWPQRPTQMKGQETDCTSWTERCQIMCGHVLKPLQSALVAQIIHMQHKPTYSQGPPKISPRSIKLSSGSSRLNHV